MSILALVPARGGSKGIPRKNLRVLGGKPLLAYSIDQARQTPSITRVVVSTDDEEIAAVARQWGAEVIKRPAAISGDTASSESALVHALDHLKAAESYEPDLVVFLQATSPLRQPDDIQNAIEALRREEADSLFSACPVHGFIWRNQGGQFASLNYDFRNRRRRQDAPEDLIENDSIYVFKPWVLRQHNNRLGGKIAVYRMRSVDSFQIDEPAELELIEQLLSFRKRRTRVPDFSRVCLLVLDFDGVLTDNRVLVDQNGTEAVWCHRSDGWGIGRLKAAGVEILVISTEANPVVQARCCKLGIPCFQGSNDKLAVLRREVQKRFLQPSQVAYLGNDANDVDCLRWVGFPVVVEDAHPEALAAACLVTTRPGGQGAVRELVDLIRSHLRRTGAPEENVARS